MSCDSHCGPGVCQRVVFAIHLVGLVPQRAWDAASALSPAGHFFTHCSGQNSEFVQQTVTLG